MAYKRALERWHVQAVLRALREIFESQEIPRMPTPGAIKAALEPQVSRAPTWHKREHYTDSVSPEEISEDDALWEDAARRWEGQVDNNGELIVERQRRWKEIASQGVVPF